MACKLASRAVACISLVSKSLVRTSRNIIEKMTCAKMACMKWALAKATSVKATCITVSLGRLYITMMPARLGIATQAYPKLQQGSGWGA